MLKKLARIGATALAVAGLGAAAPALAQQKGGALNVATIGEPNTLDPMVAAGDLLGMITQHFYETLYTFDAQWNVVPMLAEAAPKISADGKVYTIMLRKGVMLNDGQTLPAGAERMDDPALWPRDPPVRFRKSVPDGWIRLTIREGRNRQVRRMTAAVGFPTLRLVRWSVGDWSVAGLEPGQWREVEIRP